MRLIDGDALFDALYCVWGTEIDAGPANEFMGMINEAPTITPESLVRHGRWIKEWSDIPGREIERCSECQAEMHDRNQFWDAPYCPSCGVKMDLEE